MLYKIIIEKEVIVDTEKLPVGLEGELTCEDVEEIFDASEDYVSYTEYLIECQSA